MIYFEFFQINLIHLKNLKILNICLIISQRNTKKLENKKGVIKMKKYILGLFIAFIFVSCGEKEIKIYTKAQKEKMVKLADENPKAKTDLDKLLENLEIEAKNGNKKATNELDEFQNIINWRVTPAKPNPVDFDKILESKNY